MLSSARRWPTIGLRAASLKGTHGVAVDGELKDVQVNEDPPHLCCGPSKRR